MLSYSKGVPIGREIVRSPKLESFVIHVNDGSVEPSASDEEDEEKINGLIERLDSGRMTEKEFLRRVAMMPEKSGKQVKEVHNPDCSMTIIPSNETERIFIAGKSGVGKSTVAARYMMEYCLKFPDRKVILFSRHDDDPAFKDVKHMAIALDPEIVLEPPQLEHLKDALVVFDDCDNLQDKDISKAINKLNGDIISNGRKFNIHTLYLAHMICNGGPTRAILNEANRVVFFLAGSVYHSDRWLKVYAGVDNATRKRILGLPSRWVCISTGYPMYCLYDKGAFIIGR